ncbi:hypothetical protein B5X24_HaOG209892 [Helicoverpa armigera]|uniref:Reverse transcriptase domain-containing protein n=1 Tax=Helicoverpa armigera TaxID=29058 RepID=A0A2W1BHQ8_HELAM|nr:hypothetical protein B5X24_HaOG209892 [Helicoverpa armigera]
MGFKPIKLTSYAMRLRNRVLPQAGTGANRDGESRPTASSLGCPSYSGGGTVSQPTAQSQTAAVPHDDESSCSSLFSSIPSSSQSFCISPSPSLSSASIQSVDVVQETNFVNEPVPNTSTAPIRRKWTKEMNEFILRTYLHLTILETDTKTYLQPLHTQFSSKFPHMQVSRQRVGDQRRAIVNKKLLPQDAIDRIYEEVRGQLHVSPTQTQQHSTQNNTLHTGQRMKWEQRLSDQQRAIVNNKYINSSRLAEIKRQVSEQLRISINRIEDQSNTQTLPNTENYNDDYQTLNTELANTQNPNLQIHSEPHITFDIGQDDLINNIDIEAFIPSQNNTNTASEFNPIIEDTFTQAKLYFLDTHPTNRPYIPKQKTSKKFSVIVNYIDTKILPNNVNADTNFNTLQSIIYCAAWTAAKCNGAKISEQIQNQNRRNIQKKPKWRIRLEKKIDKLRANIGRLTQYSRGNRSRKVITAVETVKSTYQLHAQHEDSNTQIEHFLDTLKQKLNAAASRLRRYVTCTERKTQNAQFTNNEKIFYRNITSNGNTNQHTLETPTPENLRDFWANIWENPVEHNNNSEWLNQVSSEISEMNYEFIPIDTFIDVLKRTHSWKSPGTDNLHNYWYKKFTRIHPLIHNHLNTFIQSPHLLPAYITQGVTYMIPKDINDTVNPAKYRPITCLQTLYKILTACISEVMYTHLTTHNILAEQQKGCRKNSQGCKEQLIIDAITTNSAVKSKKEIHAMFIDYQKAFDSVPHSWLLHVLNIYKIHPTLKQFLEISMQNWQTTLKINQGSSSARSKTTHTLSKLENQFNR